MTAAARTAAAKKAWETIRARRANPLPPKKKIKPLPPLPAIKLPKNPEFVSPKDIMAKSVVMVLTFHGTGNRRKVDTANIDVNVERDTRGRAKEAQVDKEWLHLTKRLIEAEELDEIMSRYGKMRQYVERLALPSQIKRGVYIMPTAFVEQVNTTLKEGIAACQPFIKSLGKRYDEIKEESAKRLGPLFNDDDFMTRDELMAAFHVDWRFVYVDSAPNLAGISKEVADEERRKAQESWAELTQVHRQLLRGHMSEFVNHLADRLAPNEEGRMKTFQDGSITKFQQFLETFDPRNIGNDLQMKVLVDRAKDLIGGHNAVTLRTNDELREHVRQGFENIKAALDTLVVLQPKRRITFD
jgi:hypothetical protein